MENTVQTLKALSDGTRLRLLRLLLLEEEFCVCSFVDVLAMPQYHISHHLAILKRAGLVKDRRHGIWAHYSLSPDLSEAHRAIIAAACRAINEEPVAREDLARLQNHRPRPFEGCCEETA